MRAYRELWLRFGHDEFTVEDARNAGATPLELHRMVKGGLLLRKGRGRYMALHPIAALIGKLEVKEDYLPLLHFAISRLVEYFGRDLMAIVLFGSVARGDTRPESDIDLLVIASGLSRNYGERLRLLRRLMAGSEKLRLTIWKEKGLYPLYDFIALRPEELRAKHPLLLDLVEDAIPIIDKGVFKERIEGLRAELRRRGAKRVLSLSGKRFWEVGPWS